MNYQITYKMEEFDPEMDQLLFIYRYQVQHLRNLL